MKIKSIINKLKSWKKATVDNVIEDQTTIDSNFTTLAPKVLEGKSLEENKIYLEALEEAIQIPENENIALMGAYGSGKSSIMKTFEKYNPNHNYLFLSLASFIEKDNNENKGVVNQNDFPNAENSESQGVSNEGNSLETWEKIEKILVKQMIYKKTIKELPYSRFSRITEMSNRTFLFNAVLIFMLISMLNNVRIASEGFNLEISINNTLYLLIAIISVRFIYLILKYLSRIFKLSKFSFKSLTVETVNDESSYFSKYLDEIIYYFEVSKTDIVVIEDIDRFNSVVIFEHLRELNYLLNNSNQIKQPVRFIYAVRDDLFNHEGESNLKESEEYLRTKFFDFIIPIIPVVDHKNSREFLVPKVKAIIETNFSDKQIKLNDNVKHFLWGISLYIDDLRLISNICNELEIYIKKLPHIKTIIEFKKLFTLIVYKNLYPEDFDSLQRNYGRMYDVFNRKKDIILADKKNEIDKKIKNNKDILESGQYEIQIDARMAITHICLKNYGNIEKFGLQNITYFPDPQRAYSYKSLFPMTKEVIDDFIRVKEVMSIRLNGKTLSISKDEIKKSFRHFGIETGNSINKLEDSEINKRQQTIRQLEKEKRFLDTLTIQEILNNGYDKDSIIVESFKRHKLLIKFMLSEGHLDENYMYHISNFYKGTLSATDLIIVQKIKSNTILDENENIKNYDAVLFELSESDYIKPSILIEDMIIHIFNKPNSISKQEKIIDAFTYKVDNVKKMELLRKLLDKPYNKVSKFISMTLKENPETYSELMSDNKKDDWFEETFAYQIFALNDNELLQTSINKDWILQSRVEKIPSFVPILYSKYSVNEEELNNLFATNKFKFVELGLGEMSDSNVEHFVANSLYQINTKNVFDIYEKLINKSEKYFSLSELLTIEIEELTQQINENFDDYIQLLSGRENHYEEGEILLRILNESEVNKELKHNIIKNNEYNIDDVTEVDDLDLRKCVFQHRKYIVCLKNIMKANHDEYEYIATYFQKTSMVQQFIEEASEMYKSDDGIKKELQQFLIKMVNQYGHEVNEVNIELFKYVDEYSTEKINELTFETLLNAERLKPTAANINELSGKNKIKLMSTDETTVSKGFHNIELNNREIVIGISVLGGELRNKIIARSFENGKLNVSNKVEWLKQILNQNIELNAAQINNLFLHEEILEDDTILDYLVFIIPKNILTEPDLLNNIHSIDESLTAIQRGSRKTNKVDKKYYDLLKVLESERIISSVEIKDNEAVFYNFYK